MARTFFAAASWNERRLIPTTPAYLHLQRLEAATRLHERLEACGMYAPIILADRPAELLSAVRAHPGSTVFLEARGGADRLVALIKSADPMAVVMVVAGRRSAIVAAACLAAGASGVINLSVSAEAPAPASGSPQTATTGATLSRIVPRTIRRGLTPRQLEVLQLMSMGLSAAEIAERTHTPQNTVKSRIQRLNARLGAENRAHAVALGIRYGYLPDADHLSDASNHDLDPNE